MRQLLESLLLARFGEIPVDRVATLEPWVGIDDEPDIFLVIEDPIGEFGFVDVAAVEEVEVLGELHAPAVISLADPEIRRAVGAEHPVFRLALVEIAPEYRSSDDSLLDTVFGAEPTRRTCHRVDGRASAVGLEPCNSDASDDGPKRVGDQTDEKGEERSHAGDVARGEISHGDHSGGSEEYPDSGSGADRIAHAPFVHKGSVAHADQMCFGRSILEVGLINFSAKVRTPAVGGFEHGGRMMSAGQPLGVNFSTYKPPTSVSDEIIAIVDLFDEIVLFELREAARDRGPVVVEVDGDYRRRKNLQFFRLCQDVQDPILTLGHPLGTLPNRHSIPVLSFGVFSFTGNRYGTVFSDHGIVIRFKCTRDYVATTRDQFADPSLMGPVEKRTPLQAQRARVRSRENGTRPMNYFDTAADKGRDTTAGQHTIDWDAVRSEVGE